MGYSINSCCPKTEARMAAIGRSRDCYERGKYRGVQQMFLKCSGANEEYNEDRTECGKYDWGFDGE